MNTVNRTALVILVKMPMLEWINSCAYEESHKLTLSQVNDEAHTYLVDGIDDSTDLKKIMKKHFKTIFENEMEAWITDESMWIENISIDLFFEFFEVYASSIVHDLSSEPLLLERL